MRLGEIKIVLLTLISIDRYRYAHMPERDCDQTFPRKQDREMDEITCAAYHVFGPAVGKKTFHLDSESTFSLAQTKGSKGFEKEKVIIVSAFLVFFRTR